MLPCKWCSSMVRKHLGTGVKRIHFMGQDTLQNYGVTQVTRVVQQTVQ